MRRLFEFFMNNIREHFMLYLAFWLVLGILDIIYILFAD